MVASAVRTPSFYDLVFELSPFHRHESRVTFPNKYTARVVVDGESPDLYTVEVLNEFGFVIQVRRNLSPAAVSRELARIHESPAADD